MSDNKVQQTEQAAQHIVSEIDYSKIRSQFDEVMQLVLDLIYYGFYHDKTSIILSNNELKLKLISHIENILQKSPNDEMIDTIVSIKIPAHLMITYNRKMRCSIFEMIIRQMLAVLKGDQSNMINENKQKEKSSNVITR